ncbi:MAG: transporter substrate-binding domain-containing protein, partial [Deltaproteobacteria bacterium]|nr:transporter substrate-binding domain-containing protein [Deltaproteobacteria bacterium]
MHLKHNILYGLRFVLFFWIVIALPSCSDVEETLPQVEVSLDNFGSLETWYGDFDEMAERNQIRALVTFNRMFYFFDGGIQRGISHDILKEFEKFINKKLDRKTFKINILFIPVTRDRLIPALLAGKGDIIAANYTITPKRTEQVDFSIPFAKGIREVLVTGPNSSPIKSVDDLAGKTIHLRRSSSYYEHLLNLNKSFLNSKKSEIKIVPADE